MEQVFKNMTQDMLARDRHRRYLGIVHEGVNRVLNRMKEFKQEINERIDKLKLYLERVKKLYIEDEVKRKAAGSKILLRFTALELERMKKSKRSALAGSGGGGGGGAGAGQDDLTAILKEVTLRRLQAIGVVVALDPTYEPWMHNRMTFKFETTDEAGWKIQVLLNRIKILRSEILTNNDYEELRRTAAKGTVKAICGVEFSKPNLVILFNKVIAGAVLE
eukprot:GILI01012843.1.p1 GENE.GILI01012843.1~~GILI01012843.1.p1  ORF type:complete len:220 (-),score=60.68 GILI01012843.1:382-1041(-)